MAATDQFRHQFYLGFDDPTYERVNDSTVKGYGGTLEEIADDDQDQAFNLLHTCLERNPDVVMNNIYVHTANWETSIGDDGYDVARAVLLGQIENGMMGGTYIYPADVVLSVTRPASFWGVVASRSTRRALAQPQPVLTLSIEPPSFAM